MRSPRPRAELLNRKAGFTLKAVNLKAGFTQRPVNRKAGFTLKAVNRKAGFTQRPVNRKAGFTLVEVAVALVIIAIGLTLCLQSLQVAKMQAAHTRNLKLARELGVMTLGQIESGLFAEELDSGYSETYANEGYREFSFEIRTGEDVFEDMDPNQDSAFHDSFAARRDREYEQNLNSDDDDEIAEEFEKVRIRITFPKFSEFRNYLDIESWMDWEQVYGSDDEDDDDGGDTDV